MKNFILTVLVLALPHVASAADAQVFERACYIEEDNALTSQIEVLQDQWTQSYTAYEDGDCQKSYLVYEEKYAYKTNQTEIDLTALEASYTIHSDEVAEVLNEMGFCGITDWKKDEKKIVTGLTCDEFQAPAAGDIVYSIFNLVVVPPTSELYIGNPTKNKNGSSVDKRHENLDPRPFTQKNL